MIAIFQSAPAATQAGTSADVGVRMFADELARSTGQSFVVDNRPGGGGNIGIMAAAKSAPDGYTMVLGNLGGNVLNQFLYANPDFNHENTLDPISRLFGVPFLLTAHAAFPANSLQELITLAKATPGAISIALDSTSVRVVYALLSRTSGISLLQVPYTGPAAAVTDVLGERVPP